MNFDRIPASRTNPCGKMSNRTMAREWEHLRDHRGAADLVRLILVGSAMLLLWSIF